MAKITCKSQVIIGHPYKRETLNPWPATTGPQNSIFTHLTLLILTPYLVQTSLVPGGGEVRQIPDKVVMDYVTVPESFFKSHKFITIVLDVMFVNSAPFLITISLGIMFVNVKHIPT